MKKIKAYAVTTDNEFSPMWIRETRTDAEKLKKTFIAYPQSAYKVRVVEITVKESGR